MGGGGGGHFLCSLTPSHEVLDSSRGLTRVHQLIKLEFSTPRVADYIRSVFSHDHPCGVTSC